MKRLNRYGWLLAILLLPAAAWSQDAKLAAVDMDQAVFKSAAGVVGTKLMDGKYKENTEIFDGRKKEIDDLKAKCSVQCQFMEQNAKTELLRKIDELESKFKRDLEDIDRKLDQLRADTFGPIVKAAKEELNKIISERSYELVIDISAEAKALFPYVNERINITEELIRRIDAVKPATVVAEGKPATPAESKPK